MLRKWDQGTNSVEQKRVGLEEEWFYANNKTNTEFIEQKSKPI